MAQIRVQGYYNGRTFVPTVEGQNYTRNSNITRDETLLAICYNYFPDVQSDYWLGGDTGRASASKISY